jgi:hypothetical protein
VKPQHHQLLRGEFSNRSRLATAQEKRDLIALAKRLKIVPPRVTWKREAREVEKRLRENLTHRQQPSLLGETHG